MKKALLFVVALFASVMIMPATYALEGDDFANEATYVATVDGVNYTTLQEAIDNANGKTVTLLSDVTESITVSEGTTVTLDLGSYTLTNKSGQHTITNNGNLTVKGSGTVDNVSHGKAAVFNDKTGVATLESGTYTRSKEAGKDAEDSGGNSYYTIHNYGTMTIKQDVTIYNSGRFSSMVHNGFQDGAKDNLEKVTPTLVIDGGTFDGGLNTIKNDDYGILIINDGTFKNTTQATILNWNEATINGGTFTADEATILNGRLALNSDIGKLTINGGTFNAGTRGVIERMGGSLVDYGKNISIIGGTFNKEIADRFLQISEDQALLQDANGNYVIADKEADYSKVDSLIDEANQLDKSKYTDESVKVLENAIAAVDRSKNGLEQADVDKMALDIENAINGLVEKTVEPTVPENPDVENPDTEKPDTENPEVNESDKNIKDEEVNPKTADSISYAYIALLISGFGVAVSLKRLA